MKKVKAVIKTSVFPRELLEKAYREIEEKKKKESLKSSKAS